MGSFSKLALLVGALLALSASVLPAVEPVTVIVPYDASKPAPTPFPDQFYLPYERFLELWQKAKAIRTPVPVPAAPVAYAINSARYEGRVEQKVVRIHAVLDLSVTADGWTAVPLSFGKVMVSAVQVDGAPAVLKDATLFVPKAGRHRVEVSFEVLREDAAWELPAARAAMVDVELPELSLRASVFTGTEKTPCSAIERVVEGRRTLTAAVGSADSVRVTIGTAESGGALAAEPAHATVHSFVMLWPNVEEVVTEFTFSLPQTRLDHFSVRYEKGLNLDVLQGDDIRDWTLREEAGMQVLEVHLNAPVSDSYRLLVDTWRPVPALPASLTAPRISAAARRVETWMMLSAQTELDVTPKIGAGMRQSKDFEDSAVPQEPDHVGWKVGAYEGDGILSYRVVSKAPQRQARVDYVFQLNGLKIELIASMLFSGEPLRETELEVPAGFEVQALESARIEQWWREGNRLHVRFQTGAPDAPSAPTPLVVYLVRLFQEAQPTLELHPIGLSGFQSVTGEAIVTAHKAVSAGLTLTGDAREIAPELASTAFQILFPLERKRGLRFKSQDFSGTVNLTPQPTRSEALWVMHAQAHEGWVAASVKARVTLRQGSLDRAVFSLPAALPEARVSGEAVRETRSRIEGDRRIYEVQFQSEIEGFVDFGVDFEIAGEGETALPALTFPEAHSVRAYVLADNASDSELTIRSSGVDPAPLSEIPWLPALSKSAGVFRLQPGASVSLAVEHLEKAASRSAFCAWAEITTAVRTDGSEWHRVTWRLQNRSLQFLPVQLPAGAELASVRVAKKNVRADKGSVEGREVVLIPLIKTRPGDLSYDVEMVYRMKAAPLSGWLGKRDWNDPLLVGITVERTFWNLWLPENLGLHEQRGNLEAVIGEMAGVEKLEGDLEELRRLSSVATSSAVSDETRANARDNWGVLSSTLKRSSDARRKNTRGDVALELTGNLSKESQRLQNGAAENKRELLSKQLEEEVERLAAGDRLEKAKAPATPPPADGGKGSTSKLYGRASGASENWLYNGSFANAPAPAKPQANVQVAGNLGVNDNVVLQQQQQQLGAVPSGAVGGAQRQPVATAAKPQQQAVQTFNALNTARGNRMQAEQPVVALPSTMAGRPTRRGEAPSTNNPTASLSADSAFVSKNAAADKKDAAAASVPESQWAGRISLPVDFATEGQVYHFKKLKANAQLGITALDTGLFEPWKQWAGFALLMGAVAWIQKAVRRRASKEA